MRVGFADCVFDSAARELVRAHRPVALSPKAFQLLGALLAKRPQALSKAELHDLLWPGTFVAHTSLARLVTEIRRAIGDDRRSPRFIRTVHGFGYAFSGTASDLSGRSRLGGEFSCGLLWGPREIGLAEGENLIGRAADCSVRIDSARVSRHHARILVADGRATLEDLGSKNGTFVGKRRIEGPVSLADGDEICVGSAVLFFRSGYGPGSTETG